MREGRWKLCDGVTDYYWGQTKSGRMAHSTS
jgi:hypothetical protein